MSASVYRHKYEVRNQAAELADRLKDIDHALEYRFISIEEARRRISLVADLLDTLVAGRCS